MFILCYVVYWLRMGAVRELSLYWNVNSILFTLCPFYFIFLHTFVYLHVAFESSSSIYTPFTIFYSQAKSLSHFSSWEWHVNFSSQLYLLVFLLVFLYQRRPRTNAVVVYTMYKTTYNDHKFVKLNFSRVHIQLKLCHST